MTVAIGIALQRRTASLAVVESRGRGFSLSLGRRVARSPRALADLLRDLPAELRGASLSIALSPGLVACGDAWPLPNGVQASAVRRLAPSLCEARCAGEGIEDLAIDVRLWEGVLRAVALPEADLDVLRESARGFRVQTVTALPAALQAAAGDGDFVSGGERVEVRGPSWRAFPVDAPDQPGTVRIRGLEVPRDLAAAVAVALADPDLLPNALNAVEARRSVARRFSRPLVNVAAAAALFLASLGVRFHRETGRRLAELDSARRAERELWTVVLPAEPPQEDGLLRAMKKRLEEIGETPGDSDGPSALAFWAEIGRRLPDAEAIGLTLETLDLAPDGGRLSARVAAVKEDPLRNAAQLEGELNKSDRLKARGDYEVREGQVQVRLRMDFKP